MGETKAVTTQAKVQSIRSLFNDNRVKGEIQKALPKHLSADKLIRVAMTSIQRSPKLMECSQQSLLGCIMTCAALGLEPDQFLGQAYLVPFWNKNKNCYEAQLIPGYRGYIALARRTGEVQSVSAQVVYQQDHFDLQYGLNEKLVHVPAEGDRGEVRGAYVIFRYKDGAYSFDYLPKSDIDKIRARSQSSESGPWVTDYPEMAKKSVIKRHAKLVPLSVEFQKAVALEDRSNLGESQMDLLTEDDPGMLIEAPIETKSAEELLKAFDASIPKGADPALVEAYLAKVAESNKKTVEEIKIAAAADAKELAGLWKLFPGWCKQQKAKVEIKKVDALTGDELAPGPCPARADGATIFKSYCDKCIDREGCPVWTSVDK